jgi:hypothetical protein
MNKLFSKVFDPSNLSNLIGLLIFFALTFAVVIMNRIFESRLEKRQRSFIQKDVEKRMREQWRKERRQKILYAFLMEIPFLNKALFEIRTRLFYITPYDDKDLREKTMDVFGRGVFLAVIVGSVTFLGNVIPVKSADLISVTISLIGGYVVFREYVNTYFFNMRDEADSELNSYLTHVKHEYYAHRKVGESVLYGAENISYNMSVRARHIYNIITGSNSESRVFDYVNDRRRGFYLRLFMNQVFRALKGDSWNGPESLFCKNIDYLRRDIPTYRLDRKKRRTQFTGYTACILLPLLIMNLIKMFGKGFSVEMAEFYQTYGYIWQAVNIFATVSINNFVSRKKELTDISEVRLGDFFIDKLSQSRKLNERLANYDNFRPIKKIKKHLDHICADIDVHGFIIKSLLLGLSGLLIVLGVFGYSHLNRRKALVTTIVYDDFLSGVPERQIEEAQRVTFELLKELKDVNISYVSESRVVDLINERSTLRNMTLKEEIARAVMKQMQEYHTEFYKWYEILLAVVGLLTGLLPYAELLYYEGVAKQARQSEVRMFQMIVLLEKEFPETSIAGLLAEFESCAVYFKAPLRKANLMYSKNRIEALDSLIDIESPEFCELVSSLKAVYQCGIKAAFSETELNMLSEGDMQKLSSEIEFNKSMDIADMVRLVPAIISFGFYFLVPLLMSSLRGVKDVFKLIGGQ